MKIRNGFVSNSSSSSFIVAVAKITDENKATKWIESLNTDKWSYGIMKISDFPTEHYSQTRKVGNTITVSSFQDEATLNIEGMKDDDKIIWVNISNNEGDCGRFSGCDENGEWSGEIDYDIDLDYFSTEQIKIYEGLNESNGFANIDKRYGAGRNG